MDELKLKIHTKVMRGLIASLVTKLIRSKLGYDVDIKLNDLDVVVVNGKARIHTDVELEVDNDELLNIIKSVG